MATFSGEWIKVRTDLAQDPAVIQLTATHAELVDEDHAVGKLHKLWSWADRQSPDGHAVGVTFDWVDRYIGVTNFAQTLENVGWLGKLDTETGGIYFPNWDQHNGQSAKKRAQDRQRQRNKRERDKELELEDGSETQAENLSRWERDNSVTKKKKKNKKVINPHNPPCQGERATGGTGESLRTRKTDDEWKAEAPPPELVTFCKFWNSLHSDGLVSNRVKSPGAPSVELKKTWERIQGREVVELVKQHAEIREVLQRSSFCQRDWFRPAKLLAGRSRDGQETVISKLLDGGYCDRRSVSSESQSNELKRLGEF